jgi:hypothetical protein
VRKKLFPFIALLAAFGFYVWVKSNQRGKAFQPVVQTVETEVFPFVRDTAKLVYSKHARCRMGCRQIDADEVKEILLNGKLDESRIEEDEKGVTYPLEGLTKDRQYVRIVFAPKKNEIVVVTVIDLENEWPCNCN